MNLADIPENASTVSSPLAVPRFPALERTITGPKGSRPFVPKSTNSIKKEDASNIIHKRSSDLSNMDLVTSSTSTSTSLSNLPSVTRTIRTVTFHQDRHVRANANASHPGNWPKSGSPPPVPAIEQFSNSQREDCHEWRESKVIPDELMAAPGFFQSD
jgi:hypothetical protein